MSWVMESSGKVKEKNSIGFFRYRGLENSGVIPTEAQRPADGGYWCAMVCIKAFRGTKLLWVLRPFYTQSISV